MIIRSKMYDPGPGLVLETPCIRMIEDESFKPQETEADSLRRQIASVESIIRGMASIPGTSAEVIGAYGFAAGLVGGILRPFREEE
jgi:hypothetical protein